LVVAVPEVCLVDAAEVPCRRKGIWGIEHDREYEKDQPKIVRETVRLQQGCVYDDVDCGQNKCFAVSAAKIQIAGKSARPSTKPEQDTATAYQVQLWRRDQRGN
jgi:hypothetical protein